MKYLPFICLSSCIYQLQSTRPCSLLPLHLGLRQLDPAVSSLFAGGKGTKEACRLLLPRFPSHPAAGHNSSSAIFIYFTALFHPLPHFSVFWQLI